MRSDPNRWFTDLLMRRQLTQQDLIEAATRAGLAGLSLGVTLGFALARLPKPWSWGGPVTVAVLALIVARRLERERRGRR